MKIQCKSGIYTAPCSSILLVKTMYYLFFKSTLFSLYQYSPQTQKQQLYYKNYHFSKHVTGIPKPVRQDDEIINQTLEIKLYRGFRKKELFPFFNFYYFLYFKTMSQPIMKINTLNWSLGLVEYIRYDVTNLKIIVNTSIETFWVHIISTILHICVLLLLIKQAQRRAAAGRSQHKSNGVNKYLGSYFPTRCPKLIFIILIDLVKKKHT